MKLTQEQIDDLANLVSELAGDIESLEEGNAVEKKTWSQIDLWVTNAGNEVRDIIENQEQQ